MVPLVSTLPPLVAPGTSPTPTVLANPRPSWSTSSSREFPRSSDGSRLLRPARTSRPKSPRLPSLPSTKHTYSQPSNLPRHLYPVILSFVDEINKTSTNEILFISFDAYNCKMKLQRLYFNNSNNPNRYRHLSRYNRQ